MYNKGGVHGHGPWQGAASPKLEKPPSSQDDGLALPGLVVRPTMTSPLECSGRCLLITKMAILVAPFLGAVLLTALYTGTATVALSSPRAGAPVTLWRAQSPCALCRGDRCNSLDLVP